MATVILRPSAAGDIQEFNRISGGTDPYAVMGDNNDGTLLWDENSNDNIALFNLPSPGLAGTITKVTAYVRGSSTSNTYHMNIRPAIKTGGTSYYGDYLAVFIAVGEKSKEWTTNPQTTVAWTWDDINSLQCGIQTVDGYYAGANVYARDAWVVVTYTPPITVTTQAVTAQGKTTCTGNGNITEVVGDNATVRGMCYSTSVNPPTTADSTAHDDGDFGTGAFTTSITGLTAGTKYFVCAYAIQGGVTYYGSVVTFVTKSTAAWYDPLWTQRKLIVHYGSADGTLTNYQRKITVYRSAGTDTGNSVYVGTSCKTDYSDIRFAKADGTTLLDYWIESSSESSADIWVEFDSITSGATVDTLFFMYYGHAGSPDAVSNGANTFIFFDHFDGASLDTDTNWTLTAGATSVTASKLRVIGNTGNIFSKATHGVNRKFRASISHANNTSYGCFGFATATNYSNLFYAHYPTANVLNALNRNPYPTEAGVNLGNVAYNAYNIFEIRRNSTTNAIYSVNNGTGTTIATAVPTGSININVFAQGQDIYVDWILIANNTTNEPVVDVWGAEETYVSDYTPVPQYYTKFLAH